MSYIRLERENADLREALHDLRETLRRVEAEREKIALTMRVAFGDTTAEAVRHCIEGWLKEISERDALLDRYLSEQDDREDGRETSLACPECTSGFTPQKPAKTCLYHDVRAWRKGR